MAESDAVLDVTEPQDVEMATLDEGKPSAEEEAPYNPDRQAAVREFLDFTEYLPSDIARSLNILRRMDETFENAKKQLEEHTLAVANASNGSSGSSIPRSNGLPPLSNGLCAPTPDSPVVTSGKIVLPCDRAMALRVSIAQSLKRCRMARMQSKVESERLSLNINRHLSRASHIVEKIKQIEIPDDLPVDQTMKESPRKKVTLRIGNTWTTPQGSPQKKRPTIRLNTGGRSRDESEIGDGYDTSGIEAAQKKKRRASNVGPRQAPPPPPTLPNGDPLPDSQKPWNQLMPHELARLRKRMKKNAAWTPSTTMIHKELEALGRGVKHKDAYKHQWLGKKVEFIPAEAGGIGYAAIQAVKEPEPAKVMNKGHFLAQAKKKKKEREKMEAEMRAKEGHPDERGSGEKERRKSITLRLVPDDDDIEMKDVDSLPPITPADAEAPRMPKPILKRRKSSTTKSTLPKIPSLQPPVEMAIDSEAETERDTERGVFDPMDIDPAPPRRPPSPILPDISAEDLRLNKASDSKQTTQKDKKRSPEVKQQKKKPEDEKDKKLVDDKDKAKAIDAKEKKKSSEKKKPVDDKDKKKSPDVKDKKKIGDDKPKASEEREGSRPPILPEFRPVFEPILPPPDDEVISPRRSTPSLKSPSKEKSGPLLKADSTSKAVPAKAISTPKPVRSGSTKKKESPLAEKIKETKDSKPADIKPAAEEKPSSKAAPDVKGVKVSKETREVKETGTAKDSKDKEKTSEKEPEKAKVKARSEPVSALPSPEESDGVSAPVEVPKEPTPVPASVPASEPEPTPESDIHDGPSLQLEMEKEKEEALAAKATPLTESALSTVPEEPKASPALPSMSSLSSDGSMDGMELTPPPELEPDDVELALAAESEKAAAAAAKSKPKRKAPARSSRSRKAAKKKEEDEVVKEPTPPPKEPSPLPDIPFDLLPRRTAARAARALVTEPPPARGTKRKREPTPKEPTPPPPPAPKRPKRKGPRWSKKRRAKPSDNAATNEPEIEENEEEEEEETGEDEERFCLCRDVSRDTMVLCDNPQCEKQWFHLDCVGLEEAPTEHAKWFCPECIVTRDEGTRKRRKR